jgi:hypothetical protein
MMEQVRQKTSKMGVKNLVKRTFAENFDILIGDLL